MADLKLVFVAVVAALFMCQMVSARPDTPATGDDTLTLQGVEARVNIAVDDVKKNFQDFASKTEKVLQELRTAAQSPETQNMLNNLNEQLAKLATNVQATAKDLTSRIQSSIPTTAPAS